MSTGGRNDCPTLNYKRWTEKMRYEACYKKLDSEKENASTDIKTSPRTLRICVISRDIHKKNSRSHKVVTLFRNM